MKPDQDDFDSLRGLLALKRYEQPPPGYFKGFSIEVISRLEAGETATTPNRFLSWLSQPAVWLQNLWDSIEGRPILAGACGFAFCGFLATGMLYADKAPSASVMAISSPFESDFAAIPAAYSPTNALFSKQSAGSSLFEELQRSARHPQAQLTVYRP